ncbi:MAG: PilN domain-containing protein [Deltaproteobacteria bacterium]|nr:PilN domain-containing protein [Deltaproteobacteria bacterium]
MIRINLLPVREVEREAGRRQETRLVYLSAILVLVVLAGIEVASRMRLAPLKKEYAQLQADIVALDKKSVELAKLETERKDLEEKLKTIATLEAKKIGPVNVLADLSDAAPEQVWLLEFKESGGLATISGLGLDDQTIADFMRKLGGSPYFDSVDLVETAQSELDGVQLKRFVVNARLSYSGKSLGAAPRNLKFPEPTNKGGTKRKPGQRKGNRA